MAAGFSPPQARWRDSPYLPALLILSIFFVMHKQGLTRLPQLPNFVQVDTFSENNWTQVEVPKMSLTRVHQAGLLHHRVWILPFDEMWHVALSEKSVHDTCAGALGAVEAHVTAGATIASAASDVAGRVRRSRRVAPLLPLGRPFVLQEGSDRELVHVFAMVVQGVFPRGNRKWFSRVMQPVAFVRETAKAVEKFDTGTGTGTVKFCSKERAEWLGRAVAYAVRRFKLKGFVPRSNPMDDAQFDEAICCNGDIDTTEDLEQCGRECNKDGVYNIVSVFPQAS